MVRDGGASGRPLVLIVHDDPAVRRMLARELARLGALTVGASTAVAAYGVAERRLPDAIVTELSVPGLDGAGLLGRLRESGWGRRIPVVVFSAGKRTPPASEALDWPGVLLVTGAEGLRPVLAHLASVLSMQDALPRTDR